MAVQILGNRSKIDLSLNIVLQSRGAANIFVTVQSGTSEILSSFKGRSFETRADRITSVKFALFQHAAASQEELLKLLRTTFPPVTYQSFWISNQVYIKGASVELVQRISQIPSVASIAEEIVTNLMKPIVDTSDREVSSFEEPTAQEWGVSLIQAPEAWGLDGGNRGENVVVATIDTGVRVTHEALQTNFLGEFGWFDPYAFTATPNDQDGHGTHVTGILAGQGSLIPSIKSCI